MSELAGGWHCTQREREVLDTLRAWPGVPATVTFEQEDSWKVVTSTADAEAHYSTLPDPGPAPVREWPDFPAPATHEAISSKYEASQLKAGWTLFACPQERLLTAGYAILALNPAGGGAYDECQYEETWDCPGGNAYFHECWGKDGASHSAIQKEVLAWHQLIGIHPDQSLAAYFSPFRTPNEVALWQADGDLFGFSVQLWETLLPRAAAHTFLAMGKTVGSSLEKLLNAEPVAKLPIEWGNCAIRVALSADGKRVVTMPHPSRYKLFGSEVDRSSVRARTFLQALSMAR